jgi:1-acyl-sn-glycerol-3-phosphate acyltransferase
VIWLRSLLFFAWFFLLSVPLAILYAVLLALPPSAIRTGMRVWGVVVVASLRLLAGVRVEVRGREHMPVGAVLVASKHQCWLDFVVFLALLPEVCFVMKKELMKIPFFGWHASKAGMIPVDREAHAKALKAMLRAAKARAGEGRQILIFPEGTRTEPGAAPDYKPGVAALYRELQTSCAPVATNSGVHWPARGWRLTPGRAVYEFLPPIAAGLKRDAFMAELQDRIETASDRLLAEHV